MRRPRSSVLLALLRRSDRGWARGATWAALLGLVGLLFMPLAPATAGRAAGDAMLVPVCTADGIVMVALGPDGEPYGPEPDHRHGATCWFCVAHGGFSVPALSAPLLSPPRLRLVDEATDPIAIVPVAQFLTIQRSRAPPLAAL